MILSVKSSRTINYHPLRKATNVMARYVFDFSDLMHDLTNDLVIPRVVTYVPSTLTSVMVDITIKGLSNWVAVDYLISQRIPEDNAIKITNSVKEVIFAQLDEYLPNVSSLMLSRATVNVIGNYAFALDI